MHSVCMTSHAAPQATAERVAAEVRADMARQNRTANELAQVLQVTAHTAGRRLNGSVPFNVIELALAADWLHTTSSELLERATSASVPQAVAS